MMAQAFNPSTRRQRQANLCEVEASLVYILSAGPRQKKKKVGKGSILAQLYFQEQMKGLG